MPGADVTPSELNEMWPDNETGNDLLGFDVHAELLAGLVTNQRLLPLTVGLFGDWGGGKSSVMSMLRGHLEARDDIACLHFNGWTFEGYDDAKAALIASILLQLGEHKRIGPAVRDRVVPLLKRVNYLRIATFLVRHGSTALSAAAGLSAATGFLDPAHALAAVAASGAGADAAKLFGEVAGGQGGGEGKEVDWTDLLRADKTAPGPLDLRSFRDDFSKLLADTDISALVVLIDDLDRCSPPRLIDNLEAIKLFLAVSKTAFVIAADQRIVRHAIATRYAASHAGGAATALDLVTDYLEKVVQVPYHLPHLSPSEVESYINLLFCELLLDGEALARVKACRGGGAARSRNTLTASLVREVLGTTATAELARSLGWAGSIGPRLAEGLKGNPRQVKRMLNALMLRRQMASLAGIRLDDQALVKLMILEYSRLGLFQQLYSWQAGADGHARQLARLEARVQTSEREREDLADDLAPWAEPWVENWLQMEPALGELDLGDYFWVARDRVRPSRSQLADASPLIRRLAEQLSGENDIERKSAERQLADLSPNEAHLLVQDLAEAVRQDAADSGAAKGLVAAVRARVPGAAQSLVASVRDADPDRLHPATPINLVEVARVDPSVEPMVRHALEALATSTSRSGRAAQSALKTLDRSASKR